MEISVELAVNVKNTRESFTLMQRLSLQNCCVD